MSLRKLVPLLALFLTGCSPGCGRVPVPMPPDDPPVLPLPPGNGLEGDDRSRFHHLAEGSEVYPLSWLLALTNRDTNQPFLQNTERFGLLADPNKGGQNPYGLPVGVTVAESSDLRFAKVQMVGVNCAACHVNDLYLKGERVVRIDGAPNLLDLGSFYGELARDTEAVFLDAGKAWNFAQRLYGVYNPAERSILVAGRIPDVAAVEGLGKLSDLKASGELERDLAARIAALHEQELAMPVLDLRKGVQLSHPDKRLPEFVKETHPKPGESPKTVPEGIAAQLVALRVKALGEVKTGDLKALAAKKPLESSRLSQLTPAAREAALGGALSHFVETVRLLRARAAFLIALSRSHAGRDTPSLFGRVDAFGGARNFIFPGQDLALNAPISYPHLWNLKQIKWFHWDGNTTSLLERNVGQAIGLGAVFDPNTFSSTVLVNNIEELEGLAGKITPPVWPAHAFGRIDETKRARGEVLFNAHCLKCHARLLPGEMVKDTMEPLDKVGTDPARAENFARPVNGDQFDVALSDALKKITVAAGGTVSEKKEWRITKEYVSRPLVAPWATAPYLHNNSVPTLYHLLLPAANRPKTFPLGHREYDPVKLGYTTEAAGPPSVLFDTSLPGNSNVGHEYGVADLKDEADRMALLEYLKSL